MNYLDDLEDYLRVGEKKREGELDLELDVEFPGIIEYRRTQSYGLIGRIRSQNERLLKTVSVPFYHKLREN